MRKDRRIEVDPLEELFHPALAFGHPSEVVSDPDLTLGEKRAILASWASDACAVAATPELRRNAIGAAATYDEICDALRQLDRLPDSCDADRWRSRARRKRIIDLEPDERGGLL